MITAREELAMGDATHRQGVAMPGAEASGMVLVAAVSVHKADGVRYLPGQQYYLPRERALAAHARQIAYIVGGTVVDWWGAKGRVLSPWPDKEVVQAAGPTPGALKIVQGCGYDPGSAAYRFHAAVNQETPHASAFVRWGHSNPFSDLRQYDGEADAHVVREAILGADVLHCHVDYLMLNNAGLARRHGQLLIRHYHGSVRPEDAERLGWWTHLDWKQDRLRSAKLVGARLSFFAEAERLAQQLGEPVEIEWLPITVPVARYRRLATKRPKTCPEGVFRVAHCPTKRINKGTDVFLKVIDRLQAKGLKVVPVLMERESQRSALEIKRTCDATFDSFWLGIQTSGLEAGAMGQPVIAGDPEVRHLHRTHVGECPYTFANEAKELEGVLERLIVDRPFYEAEAARVSRYVEQYHDYPAVARRYCDLLAKWMPAQEAAA